MSALLPIVTSGTREIDLGSGGGALDLPMIPGTAEEAAALRRLSAVLDGNHPAPADDGTFPASAADDAAIEDHLAGIYRDPTYQAILRDSFGIGGSDGGCSSSRRKPQPSRLVHSSAIPGRTSFPRLYAATD